MTRNGIKKACGIMANHGFFTSINKTGIKAGYLYFGKIINSDYKHRIFTLNFYDNDATFFDVRIKEQGKEEECFSMRYSDFGTMKDFANWFYSLIKNHGCYCFSANAGI